MSACSGISINMWPCKQSTKIEVIRIENPVMMKVPTKTGIAPPLPAEASKFISACCPCVPTAVVTAISPVVAAAAKSVVDQVDVLDAEDMKIVDDIATVVTSVTSNCDAILSHEKDTALAMFAGGVKNDILRLRESVCLLLGESTEAKLLGGASDAVKRKRAIKRLRKKLIDQGMLPSARKPLIDAMVAKKTGWKPYTGSGAYAPGSRTVAGQRFSGRGGFLSDFIGGARTMLGLGAYKKKFRGRGAFDTAGGTGIDTGTMKIAAPVPAMHSTQDFVDVYRREYLGDIITNATAGVFQNTLFHINPGLNEFLPWGANIFANFQEWEMVGAGFEFRSSCGSSTTTGALGTVTMAIDYNSLNPAATTKVEMDTLAGSVTCKIDESATCLMECDPKQNGEMIRYVRTGTVPTGGDIHSYDHGTFQVATQGCAASINIGNLYVFYHIRAYKPRIGSYFLTETAHYKLNSADATHPLGATATAYIDTIGVTVGANTITFPAGCIGKYQVIVTYKLGSSGAVTIGAWTLTTNATGLNIYSLAAAEDSSQIDYPYAGTTCAQASKVLAINVTNPNLAAVITMANLSAATVSFGDLYVSELNIGAS